MQNKVTIRLYAKVIIPMCNCWKCRNK